MFLDAYGTILDTGDGSVSAAARILEKAGSTLDPARFYAEWKRIHREHISALECFANEEAIFRLDLACLYREHRLAGDAAADAGIMLETLTRRSAFPDAPAAIRELRLRGKVFIASNTDTAPLMENLGRSGIQVDGVLTSESLQAYKPRREFFLRMLDAAGAAAEDAVYAGDSWEDDVAGAAGAGIRAVWINRKRAAPLPTTAQPLFALPSLSSLAQALSRRLY